MTMKFLHSLTNWNWYFYGIVKHEGYLMVSY